MATFKENKIKETINFFYQALHTFQKEIISGVYPQLISREKFCEVNNWWYVKNEGLHAYILEGELCFANAYSRSNYASFLEKNVAFNRLPDHKIKVLPDEVVTVDIQGETSNGLAVKIAIVEYSETKKEVATLVDLNKKKKIVLNKNTKYLRLALKITGKGVFRIKKVVLDRVFEKTSDFSPVNNNTESIENFKDLKVACIFDTFTRSNYQNEVNLITFTPENWETVLSENKPHFLFVESAWHGNGGAWKYQVGSYSNVNRDNLFDLLKWCNENSIPTIFWNKEDPIHFNKFIDTAKHFDYIYTTDSNMVSEYKKHVNHDNVFPLPFAANPKLHNPIELEYPRENAVCFAGSYYANRHEERRKVMDNMLDICKEYGLVIYDRNFERTEEEFKFPKRFIDNIRGTLSYHNIDKAYKGFRFMLNVNSVTNSPTMFSRRVFEGLSSGTPVLSSYSEGIFEMFDNIVMISKDDSELKRQLQVISQNEREYYKKSLLGIREIYEKHTYKHRLSFILKNMGVNLPVKVDCVTVISIVKNENDIKKAINVYEKQSYSNKKLALILSESFNLDNINLAINEYQREDIGVYLLSYLEQYENSSEIFTTDWLAFINIKNFYGRNYLKDLMLASVYTNADFIGKNTFYSLENESIIKKNDRQEYMYVDELFSKSTIVKNTFDFHNNTKKLILDLANNNLSKYKRYGARMFSINCFNFIEHGCDVNVSSMKQVEI